MIPSSALSGPRLDWETVAADYWQCGLPVFPVQGKRALVTWGPYCDALPTPAEAADWPWQAATGLALPIGLALERLVPGIWVLDIEARFRDAAVDWLRQQCPAWEQGLVVETGSGGLHVYLRAPDGQPVRTTRCAWGDVKAQRSYVLVPPSRHPSGGEYRWLHAGGGDDWSALAVLDPAVLPGVGRAGGTEAARDGGAARWTTAAVLAGVPQGQRNTALFQLACRLRAADVPAGVAERLVAEAAAACQPPYPSDPGEESVAALIARVWRTYPPGESSHSSRSLSLRDREREESDNAARAPIPGSFPNHSRREPVRESPNGSPEAIPDSRSLLGNGNRESGTREDGGREEDTAGLRGDVLPGGGDPSPEAVAVLRLPEPEPRRWLLPGFVPEHTVTLWFGDDGSGKSTLATALAVAVATGTPFLGQPVEPGVVLYLDTEFAQDEFVRRCQRLVRGLQLTLTEAQRDALRYYRLRASLGSPAGQDEIARLVTRYQPRLLIVDSLTLGSYADDLKEATAAAGIIAFLESLPTTVLVIDHIPKPPPGLGYAATPRPWGSFAKRAKARHVVLLSATDGAAVLLRVTKSNLAPVGALCSVALHFTADAIQVRPLELTDAALDGLAPQLPPQEQLARVLALEGPRTPDQLAEQLGLAEKTVRNTLTLLRRRGRAAPLGDGRWAATGDAAQPDAPPAADAPAPPAEPPRPEPPPAAAATAPATGGQPSDPPPVAVSTPPAPTAAAAPANRFALSPQAVTLFRTWSRLGPSSIADAARAAGLPVDVAMSAAHELADAGWLRLLATSRPGTSQSRYRPAGRVLPPEPAICNWCARDFWPADPSGRFCSAACSAAWHAAVASAEQGAAEQATAGSDGALAARAAR